MKIKMQMMPYITRPNNTQSEAELGKARDKVYYIDIGKEIKIR